MSILLNLPDIPDIPKMYYLYHYISYQDAIYKIVRVANTNHSFLCAKLKLKDEVKINENTTKIFYYPNKIGDEPNIKITKTKIFNKMKYNIYHINGYEFDKYYILKVKNNFKLIKDDKDIIYNTISNNGECGVCFKNKNCPFCKNK